MGIVPASVELRVVRARTGLDAAAVGAEEFLLIVGILLLRVETVCQSPALALTVEKSGSVRSGTAGTARLARAAGPALERVIAADEDIVAV